MIGYYVIIAMVIGFAIFLCVMTWASEFEKKYKIICYMVIVAVTVAICGGMMWYLYGTESGARAIKSFQSNVDGGIERTVTVYDVEGDVIETYSGKFDVQYDSDRILFDDENGKRHVIYYPTGTVIIDEK